LRAVIQRVSEASVEVAGAVVGRIESGILALVAVERGDGEPEADWIARKIAELRIFPDAEGRMNLSAAEARSAVLLVSQFTLAADCSKGRRPAFDRAAPPEEALPLLARVRAGIEAAGIPVSEGRFGAHMRVSLVNDGPVTFVLARQPRHQKGEREERNQQQQE
jgi:D-tyrosyl-tRNA(Tyr) deacylase